MIEVISSDNKYQTDLVIDYYQDNPYAKVLGYVENDTIVGYLVYLDMYEHIEIVNIEVELKKRNQGIGSKLLEYLLTITTDKENITLEVSTINITAINLYKRFDFKEVALRKNYYQGIDGILMERKTR